MFKLIEHELLRLKKEGTLRRLPFPRSRGNGLVQYAERALVDFTCFDYLGLSQNIRVMRAAHQSLAQHGVSQTPSRVNSGALSEVLSAEERIAKFYGTESALLFSSRNQAMLSLFSALMAGGESLAFDEFCSAPVIDAGYLSEAQPIQFSLEQIETINPIVERSSVVPTCFFVEGISPLTGEHFPFAYLQRKLGLDKKLHLIIDESYALGAVGERGSGAFEAACVAFPQVSYIGALGLGLPGFGGFIASRGLVIDYLKHTSRAVESESPIPAQLAAAAEVGIDILELELVRRKIVLSSAKLIRERLVTAGFKVHGGLSSPILSIALSSFKVGREVAQRIAAKGFLVELVGLRGIRRESPLLRVVLNSSHTQEHVESLVALLVESSYADKLMIMFHVELLLLKLLIRANPKLYPFANI